MVLLQFHLFRQSYFLYYPGQTQGAHYLGVVAAIHTNGTYRISFDDGDARHACPINEIMVPRTMSNTPKYILLKNGIYDIGKHYVNVTFPTTLIGESNTECIVLGGFLIQGKKQDIVTLKNMTIQDSYQNGVLGYDGTEIVVDNCIVDNCAGSGIGINNTKGTVINCQVRRSGGSGIAVNGGVMKIQGKETTVTDNVIKKSRREFGLRTYSDNCQIVIDRDTMDGKGMEEISFGNYRDQNCSGGDGIVCVEGKGEK